MQSWLLEKNLHSTALVIFLVNIWWTIICHMHTDWTNGAKKHFDVDKSTRYERRKFNVTEEVGPCLSVHGAGNFLPSRTCSNHSWGIEYIWPKWALCTIKKLRYVREYTDKPRVRATWLAQRMGASEPTSRNGFSEERCYTYDVFCPTVVRRAVTGRMKHVSMRSCPSD